ncbi:hypothetical protein OSTOST_22009 [Ostertagia ostertagi]
MTRPRQVSDFTIAAVIERGAILALHQCDVGELLTAANLPSLYPMLNQSSSDSTKAKSGPLINLSSVDSLNPPMSCDERIIDALLSIVDAAGKEDSRLRPITLELACLVLRQILLVVDHDQMHSSIGSKASHVLSCFVDRLGLYVNSENLFLEWFEDEYAEFEVNHIKLETIGYEMLLPPCNTAMSDNSDLLSCVVVLNKNERLSRFLVTDRLQLILVEPDTRKAGWAIVRFVGLLQDTNQWRSIG